jgi:hypothetical protein
MITWSWKCCMVFSYDYLIMKVLHGFFIISLLFLSFSSFHVVRLTLFYLVSVFTFHLLPGWWPDCHQFTVFTLSLFSLLTFSPCQPFHLVTFSPRHLITIFTFSPFPPFTFSPFSRFHLFTFFLFPEWLPKHSSVCINFIICLFVFTHHLFTLFLYTVFTLSWFSLFTFCRADDQILSIWQFSPFHNFTFHLFTFSIFSPCHLSRCHLFTVFTFSWFELVPFSPFPPFHLRIHCLLPGWLPEQYNCLY